MRNLKRALSLALASVMLLGMMVVGTSAASYPDVDENDNVEAIEVLNAVKVMIGEQGNFNPDSPVNRHQMAVIMAKLVLGNETADNYVGTHPFTDVAPWADKYVAACYENGIAAGTSRTTFGGDRPLTAVEAAAFMLRALGYKDLSKDASDWSVPVTAMANQIRLFAGVASNPKEQLDRNQVAQLALNTLKSPMVDLKDNTLNISGGTGDGAFVITGGSRDYVVRSSSERYAQAINNTEWQSNSVSGVGGYTVELGEHLFNGDLRLYDNRTDDFGRPAIEWRYKSESIGTYTKEADLTYTKNVKVGTIYKDLSLNRSIDAGRVTVFVDGKQITTAGGNDLRNEIKSGDDTNGYGANGVLTQVWFDDNSNTNPNDDTIIITEVHTYVAKVNAVNKASGSTARSITLDAKTRPGTLNTKFETERFEAKDLVTYTAAWNGSKYDIVTVEPLSQSASGVLTQWVGTTVVDSNKGQAESNFTVDSTNYEYSKDYYTVKDDGTPAALWNDFTVNKSSVNVYLDKYGYAIYIEGVEGSKDWAAVIGVGQTNPYGSQTQGVTLLLTDGTQKTVTAKLASGYSWSDLTGVTTSPSWDSDNLVNEGSADLVSYIDDDGTYELTILGGVSGTGVYSTTYAGVYSANNPKVDFKNGRSTLTLTTDGTPNNTTTLFTTSNTIFLVCTDNGSDKSYNAYVGYDNMPSIDSTIGVRGIAYKQNNAYTNQVDIVYIDAANLAGTSVNTFFVKEKNHKIETTSDLGSIYRVNAIVNGEKQELMIRSTIAAVDNNATEYGLFAIDNVITNSKGVITGFKDVTDSTTFDLNTGAVGHTTTADRGTVEANGTVVGFGKNGAINANPEYAAYDAASKVYYVDKDFKDINEIGVTGVSDDSNDYVWAARDNTVPASWKKLKDMIIVEVPDDAADDNAPTVIPGLEIIVDKTTTGMSADAAWAVTVKYSETEPTIDDIINAIVDEVDLPLVDGDTAVVDDGSDYITLKFQTSTGVRYAKYKYSDGPAKVVGVTDPSKLDEALEDADEIILDTDATLTGGLDAQKWIVVSEGKELTVEAGAISGVIEGAGDVKITGAVTGGELIQVDGEITIGASGSIDAAGSAQKDATVVFDGGSVASGGTTIVSEAVVKGELTLSASDMFTANQITVKAGGKLTLPQNDKVTVQTIVLEEGSTVTLNSDQSSPAKQILPVEHSLTIDLSNGTLEGDIGTFTYTKSANTVDEAIMKANQVFEKEGSYYGFFDETIPEGATKNGSL